jgi:hypothetical protein
MRTIEEAESECVSLRAELDAKRADAEMWNRQAAALRARLEASRDEAGIAQLDAKALRAEVKQLSEALSATQQEQRRIAAERDAANKQAEIQAESLRVARAEVERLGEAHIESQRNGATVAIALRAAETSLAAATELPRWEPCQVEPNEDDDGPLFDGFLTDPAGSWVRWEDLARVLAAQPAAPCDHAGSEISIDRATGEETCCDCGQPAAPSCECSPEDLWECPVPGCPAKKPATPAYGSSPVGGANLRPEHRPTIAELIAAQPAAPARTEGENDESKREVCMVRPVGGSVLGPQDASPLCVPVADAAVDVQQIAAPARTVNAGNAPGLPHDELKQHVQRQRDRAEDEPLPWAAEAESRVERMRAAEQLDDQDAFPGMPPAGWR